MGLPVLAAICERLAKDHRFTCSGFPDLIVWDLNTKRCRIVEVKGPRDRLSTKQILWLDYLLTCGATAEVCHVVDVGAKTMKRTSVKKVSAKKVSPKKSKIDDTTDSEEILENERERKRHNKKIKASNRSTKDKKWKMKNINDTYNDYADSDSSWEEKTFKRKIRGGFEESRKIITRSMKVKT
ncbi:uncharacterized protein [Panulirus ornatus]|uniref:uncharacterized protein n=1 Tax=Panulirus ornatus TaxID=150431 RepID=UPI003A8A8B09